MIIGTLSEGQKLGVLAVLTVVAIAAIAWACWKRQFVVKCLKRWDGSEFSLAVVEGVFAFTAGGLAAFFKVWDGDMWTHRPVQTQYAFRFAFGLTICVIYAKWARDRVKDRDKDKVNDLTRELEVEKLRLNRFRRLSVQIRGLIERKIERVRDVAKKPAPTVEDFIIRSQRQTQVHTIIQAIFDFFLWELRLQKPNGRMRLGLYIPNADRTELVHAFSFDGEKRNCFSDNSDWMQISSPQGIHSEIVRVYHADGDHKLQLIPDPTTHPNFTWFRPDQKGYLKSMLIFKYLLQLDGASSALLLSLDCNEPNFFSNDRYEEISEFLVEMLKRFEYEMLGLEIVAKIPQKT